jgi:hypothetical protein
LPAEASSATVETSDVVSVVSLNGFLPSMGRAARMRLAEASVGAMGDRAARQYARL